jgi:hypothetical protein
MTAPLVSVIIPTFNRADLLPETLRSVLGQTVQALEVIVVDDGSTDDTVGVVEAMGDPRLRLIRNTWSGRPAVGRNIGIRAARAELIAFVDSDDLWLPEKLAVQLAYMEANPQSLWCFTHFDDLDSSTGIISQRMIPQALSSGTYSPKDLLCGNFIGSLTPLIQRGLLNLTGPLDESWEIRFAEDWDIWLRLSAIMPAGFIPQPLALYRHHTSNATGTPDAHAMCQRASVVLQKASKLYPAIYAPHYETAVRHIFPELVEHLLTHNEHAKARSICAALGVSPLRATRLGCLHFLGALPPAFTSCVVAFLRLARRIRPGTTLL